MTFQSLVREHIPLEQGLRLAVAIWIGTNTIRSERYSIRTRIKTLQHLCEVLAGVVREHIPLEQGLRHNLTNSCLTSASVREHIPLEQGLRPKFLQGFAVAIWSESIFH